jgi:y4mF family transcriptional regulator
MSDRAGEDDRTLAALGRALRARRSALGLRQADVADLAGCSERFVHAAEHGKASLQFDKLLAVLEVLGLGLRLVPGNGSMLVDEG